MWAQAIVVKHRMARPTVAVLPPGVYGVRCCRGPAFVESGYGDESEGVGQDNGRFGTSLIPGDSDLARWAAAIASGNDVGHWSPWRSVVVRWDESGGFTLDDNRSAAHHGYYYKAGDDGKYDVAQFTCQTLWTLEESIAEPSEQIAAIFASTKDNQMAMHRVFNHVCDKFAYHLQTHFCEVHGIADRMAVIDMVDDVVRAEQHCYRVGQAQRQVAPPVAVIRWDNSSRSRTYDADVAREEFW